MPTEPNFTKPLHQTWHIIHLYR